MVRLISRQRGYLAALKLTKLFGVKDFPAAKDSGKVLTIIIYCYLITIIKVKRHCFTTFYYVNMSPKRETDSEFSRVSSGEIRCNLAYW